MVRPLSRRRVLTVLAATAAGLALGPERGLATTIDTEWHGTAMGTDARLLFCGGEPDAIRAAIRMARVVQQDLRHPAGFTA